MESIGVEKKSAEEKQMTFHHKKRTSSITNVPVLWNRRKSSAATA
jgi:hypothetical protein